MLTFLMTNLSLPFSNTFKIFCSHKNGRLMFSPRYKYCRCILMYRAGMQKKKQQKYQLFTKISSKIVDKRNNKPTSIISAKARVLNLLTNGSYMVTFASLSILKCLKQLKYHRFDVRSCCANLTKTKHFGSVMENARKSVDSLI